MSEDVASRLRAFARDHREGRLTLSAYRRLRAPLLDALGESGSARSADDGGLVTQPRASNGAQTGASPAQARAAPKFTNRVVQPAPPRPAVTAPASRARSADRAAQPPGSTADALSVSAAPRAAKHNRPLHVAAGSAVMLAAIGVTLWLSSREAADPQTAELVGMRDAGAAYSIIQPFMDEGVWSDERIQAVNAELVVLGPTELTAAARLPWFQSFVDEVRRRLKEGQVLTGAALTPDRSPLAALALTIGLDLRSPDSDVRIVTAGQAPAPVAQPTGPGSPEAAEERESQTSLTKQPPPAAPLPASVAPSIAVATTAQTTPVNLPPQTAPTPGVTASSPAGRTVPQPSDAVVTPARGAGSCRVELARSRLPVCQDLLASGELAPTLAVVPAGTYEMGSTDDPVEQPVTQIEIRRPFAISVQEVSQAEFELFCARAGKTCPGQPWEAEDYPVVNVSWNDAVEYTRWLSEATGQRYRLPTEAEWEYAARAGRSGRFPSGEALSPTDAHFSAAAKQESPARRSQRFNRNAFRIQHAVGNVREWVQDPWSEGLAGIPADGSARAGGSSERVARGGSYVDGPTKLRLSTREGVSPSTRDRITGFRVVRELQ